MRRVLTSTLTAAVVAFGLLCAPAPAPASAKPAKPAKKTLCCVKVFNFAAGPYTVHAGSNAILFDYNNVPKPDIDGFMIKMIPNLRYAKADGKCCGSIPNVSVIHLHHGVWVSDGTLGQGEGDTAYGGFYPFMATGEEKTHFILPPGYGYPVRATDDWIFNYMIHDLTPVQAKVYVTYQVTFVPADTPLAETITAVHPIWMDVEDHHIYSVFNVMQHSGRHGVFTFPYMAPNAYAGGLPLNQFRVDHAGVLVGTAGHVHPGGLYTQLDAIRAGVTPHGGALPGETPGSVRLFRSYAHYWDPKQGPISWNMAAEGTAPDWRPHVNVGDTLAISATYDTTRASWYEVMGIMVVWEAWDSQRGIDVFTGQRERHPAAAAGIVDPFSHRLDQTGHVTHGYLPENNDDSGAYPVYTINLNKLPSCDTTRVTIAGFEFSAGNLPGTSCIPTITEGQSITFVNEDAPATADGFGTPNTPYGDAVFHTITACKLPCNRTAGISYPLANGAGFDSGQLGYGTPAANTLTWSTPTTLKPGLYTFFCRIHPFMRGVFRIVG